MFTNEVSMYTASVPQSAKICQVSAIPCVGIDGP